MSDDFEDDRGFLKKTSDKFELDTGLDHGDLASFAQRALDAQRQKKIIDLLEDQKQERVREKKRQASLPTCPFCKEKLEPEASICKHCHANLYYIPEFLSKAHYYIGARGQDEPTAITKRLEEQAKKWESKLDFSAKELLEEFDSILRQRNNNAKICYYREVLLRNKIFQELLAGNFAMALDKVRRKFTPIEVSKKTSHSYALGRTLIAIPVSFAISFLIFAFEADFLTLAMASVSFIGFSALSVYFLSFYASRSRTWASSKEQEAVIKSTCSREINLTAKEFGLSETTGYPIKVLFDNFAMFQKNTSRLLNEARKLYEYTKPKIEYLQVHSKKLGYTFEFDYREYDFLFYCDEFVPIDRFNARAIDKTCWPIWKKMMWVDEIDYVGRVVESVKERYASSARHIPNESELLDKIIKELKTLEENEANSNSEPTLRLIAEGNKAFINSQKGLVGAINTTKNKVSDINKVITPKIDKLNEVSQPFINKAVDHVKQISAKVAKEVVTRIHDISTAENSDEDVNKSSKPKN